MNFSLKFHSSLEGIWNSRQHFMRSVFPVFLLNPMLFQMNILENDDILKTLELTKNIDSKTAKTQILFAGFQNLYFQSLYSRRID